ncbi:MAG TPA: glycoside hydrolase family 97 catalytic domain-containing protein [Polyangiales bacterium]|nr:glycoside hydrolase family 97 catalytic domain-containing protein [Polyangiales bacterium]
MSRTSLAPTLFAASLTMFACESNGGGTSVASPNGELRISAEADAEGRLRYTVTKGGVTIIDSSPLGLVSNTHDLTSGVTMGTGRSRTIDERYTMLVGKRRERRVVANELTLPLEDANGAEAELIMRAQDDGVAFRYRLLGEGSSEVASESTGFAVAPGSRALLRPYDSGDIFFIYTAGSYEQPPELVPAGTPTEASGWAFPALFELEEGGLHLMITEADLDRSYCGTRLHEMPDDGLYRIRFPDEREGKGVGAVLPIAELPFSTPWRVILVGELATLVESTMVDDSSRPSVVEDTTWIEPGRAAWSWFSQGTGTPELQSEYVDFAGRYGWDYVLIDATWDQWDDAEQEVQALVAQAQAVGVELLLWYNSGGEHSTNFETPFDKMVDPAIRQQEMAKISGWGIAGIKIDFFQSDKQARIEQYIGILEDAKDYRLLVNFHGATVPRGWQRTYPHLMTHEAINGAEFYKPEINVLGDRAPTALMNVQDVLLRNVVGSMDYTPVVFEAALTEKELPYAHSLALSVLFESGIQHFADRADSNPDAGYRAVFAPYPYVADFLSTVPVAWDDTRLIEAELDGHVILARRSGAVWYLGGIHAAETSVEYSVPLDFLEEGDYELVIIEQGETPSAFSRRMESVRGGDAFTVRLPSRGGFVARID